MKPRDPEEPEALGEETKDSPLGEESERRLRAVADAYRYLAELVSEEGATIEGVRERFFARYKIVRSRDKTSADDTDSASEGTLPGR